MLFTFVFLAGFLGLAFLPDFLPLSFLADLAALESFLDFLVFFAFAFCFPLVFEFFFELSLDLAFFCFLGVDGFAGASFLAAAIEAFALMEPKPGTAQSASTLVAAMSSAE